MTRPNVAQAAGRDDACPEPNDLMGKACALANNAYVQGYISTPADIDLYRFQVSGVKSWVHLELTELPADFTLYVVDAKGVGVDQRDNGGLFPEVLDLELDPGDYFAGVTSIKAQASNDRPYKLSLSLVPADGKAQPARSVMVSDTFDQAGPYFADSSDDARYETGYYDGEYVIRLHDKGTSNAIEERGQLASIDITDFTLTVDARLTQLPKDCGGYAIDFRWNGDDSSGYELYIDPINSGKTPLFSLSEFGGGKLRDVVAWTEAPSIASGKATSHITITAVGTTLTIGVNGTTIAQVRDDKHAEGDIGLVGFTCDRATEVRFDNLLVTTPGR